MCRSDVTAAAFTAGLESAGWLRHVRAVLDAAYAIAGYLHSGESVIVHCRCPPVYTPCTP